MGRLLRAILSSSSAASDVYKRPAIASNQGRLGIPFIDPSVGIDSEYRGVRGFDEEI